MSLYTDIMYLKRASILIPKFKQKSEFLWNCKCILCGDGNHHKTRGYFFKYNNKIFYKCHHCSISLTFGQYLKQLDPMLYGEYAIETFAEENTTSRAVPLEAPVVSAPSGELDSVATPVNRLGNDHPIKKYCLDRKIPENKLHKLYALEHTKDIIKLYPRYASKKKYEKVILAAKEPRLLIPFHSIRTGQLIGVALRAIDNHYKRYIVARDDGVEPLIFGWNDIDQSQAIMVVEGPLDSLFLKNCIAVGGTSFNKIDELNIVDPILIFDNQPRNREVCKVINRFIEKEYKICIWPSNIIEKDINEMVQAGLNVETIINENIYQGITAKLKFNEWKNC